ncbi:alpha/beta fold hydrolase [soil metagenome]
MKRKNYCRFAVLVAIWIFISAIEIAGQAVVPRFEPSDCPVPVPAFEKNVQCGYVVVAENRTVKNDKTIRLPVIILKSLNPNPKPDPVLRTLGGPGVSSLRMIRGRYSSPWLKDRDQIIFEQRGTKYAQPTLECPEVDKSNIDAAIRHLDAKAARANEFRAAKICHERLTSGGIDLSAYNSHESAADIEDVRRVLKVDKLNLYGVSYSSRLMLEVMRDFPLGIRSAVLESTLAPDVNYDEIGVDAYVRVFTLLFANCKADTECAAAYPGLESEFYASVSRLNNEPIIEKVKDAKLTDSVDVYLNGNDFVTWIADSLLSQDGLTIADTPLVIHDVFSRNYDAFRRSASNKLGPDGNSWGMRYSVWCSEEFPFERRKSIDAQSTKYEGLRGYEIMSLPDTCSVWRVPPAKPIENKSVTSNIPAFVITADYDAYTPPAWGESVAKNLKNSFVIQIPWAGHGPAFTTPCLRDLIADFLNDPNVVPKSDCLEKTRRQFKFVSK